MLNPSAYHANKNISAVVLFHLDRLWVHGTDVHKLLFLDRAVVDELDRFQMLVAFHNSLPMTKTEL